jgi:DNA-binding transcriptional LysR family regulator
MQDPVETAELVAFTRIVDARSLSRAALDLGLPRATIGRRLARLEGRLGARLLRRTTRSLVLTEAGEAFYRHARLVLDAVANAEASVRRPDDAIRGDLRVTVPPIMTHEFYEMLYDFLRAHPDVRLQVHFGTRHVDLRRDGYDVAVRAGSDIEPGLIGRVLARAPMYAVASPGYLADHGTPRTAKDLRNHRCLVGFARGELPQSHWPLKGGGQIHVEGILVSNELTLLGEAARQGLGIALMPTLFCDSFLQSGELVHVLPGTIEADAKLAVVHIEREFVPPQVRAFVEAVVVWAKRELATGRVQRAQLVNAGIPRKARPVKARKRPRRA